jgi:hypothetical protein
VAFIDVSFFCGLNKEIIPITSPRGKVTGPPNGNSHAILAYFTMEEAPIKECFFICPTFYCFNLINANPAGVSIKVMGECL